jgi:hypothetical protein
MCGVGRNFYHCISECDEQQEIWIHKSIEMRIFKSKTLKWYSPSKVNWTICIWSLATNFMCIQMEHPSYRDGKIHITLHISASCPISVWGLIWGPKADVMWYGFQHVLFYAYCHTKVVMVNHETADLFVMTYQYSFTVMSLIHVFA